MENEKIIDGEEIVEEKEAETPAAPVEENLEKANDSIPDLNTAPIPTEEEKENAGLEPEKPEEPELAATALEENTETVPEPEVDLDGAKNSSVEFTDVGETQEAVLNANDPVTSQDMNPIPDPEKEKLFTQNQVNELIGKTRVETRNKTFEYIYGRYGVNDENGLDELVGNAQRYDSLREEYDTDKAAWKQETDARSSELRDLSEKVALMESGIDRERYDDAKFILKGKGLDITSENIATELASHPEWKKSEEIKTYVPKHETNPIGEISVLGNEKSEPVHGESEEEIAMNKYFKV